MEKSRFTETQIVTILKGQTAAEYLSKKAGNFIFKKSARQGSLQKELDSGISKPHEAA